MRRARQSNRIEPIALSDESTVVAEFTTDTKEVTSYQSEADLEKAFIRQLESQAYEYTSITSGRELIANLRRQLERLNKISFSDSEWNRLFKTCITRETDSEIDKTTIIQQDHIQVLTRDDGSTKNVYLLDKRHIHNNNLQVINQYEAKGTRVNRYDVTVLVNGLPMVHVELKRRGVDIREAFNQINRYQRDSFWSGSGIFDYVQLFVISNGTLTKYYSNTVRRSHTRELSGKRSRHRKSNSFAFTHWWADQKNQPIRDLTHFTKTFFAKHALLKILTRYCVFDVDKNLLVMRPYQIVATEQILQRITTGTNYGLLGKRGSGGYVWHTTGSGKTLTSFKVAQLAQDIPSVDKVLFVVDRKDLDYQTMREYERFEKGAANSNTSTAVLQKQLQDPNARIIVTTIQKLSRFVATNKTHPIYGAHVVIIFDECHRSQFGDMHAAITRAFGRYHLFGFTGTPIFGENANKSSTAVRKTTEQAFGDKLHTYTIVDAINDKNVLPFRIDYINTVRTNPKLQDSVEVVEDIDRESVLVAPERIAQIVRYILEHFNQKTRRSASYRRDQQILHGFNSLFATASINAAQLYYSEFRKQQAERLPDQQLKIALIYSFSAREDDEDGLLHDEGFETEELDRSSRDFLSNAINDYNRMFATNFDISSEKFQNYYKDVSERLKNRELDLVIVVNMLLTGFDATTLNTLWLDKRLRAHGLLQAYSRTNRILNSVKTYGNIVSFRNLEKETNDALALFGNKDAKSIVLLKPYADYYSKYIELVNKLVSEFPLDKEIVGESNRLDFVRTYSEILRLKNVLTSFDQFIGNEVLSDRAFQDYQSIYLNLYADSREGRAIDSESIEDDVVFEIELIKQVDINVDYILLLVQQHVQATESGEKSEIKSSIERAVDSSPVLRKKKDLVEAFVESLSATTEIDTKWQEFVNEKMKSELDMLIRDENLNADATRAFVDDAFSDGSIPFSGTSILKVLPPISRFSQDNALGLKKTVVLERLTDFFDRFYDLV